MTCGAQHNFGFLFGEVFEVSEEVAALQSLTETMTGEDIFCNVCQTMEELDLDWSKLASITTDGTPNMIGASQGLVGRVKIMMEEQGFPTPLSPLLIHQQALGCMVLRWESVTKVVSCINFMKANRLKHRQF